MDFKLSTASFISEKNFVPLDKSVIYDLFIIGGGPAGLTAAVYAMRKGLNTGIVVKTLGGQVADTADVENYMGYKHITGVDLVEKFRDQVHQFSIGYEEGAQVSSFIEGKIKKIEFSDGRVFSCRALIIASGKSWRRLGVPGEDKFTGRGVAFCTVCDAPLFAGKKVVVVGGGNSGLESVIDLAPIASAVTVIQNLSDLTGDPILIDKVKSFGNVTVVYNSIVEEIMGDEIVSGVKIRDLETGKIGEVDTDGVFVEIGLDPNSKFVPSSLELNQYGEIPVDCNCKTSLEGVFAAGDVTNVAYKQIIIAGGEGAKAALSAWDYLLKNREEE